MACPQRGQAFNILQILILAILSIMAKYQLKTKQNSTSVSAFINSIEDAQKKADAKKLLALFKKATGKTPKMWGSSIIGFGSYHYVYPSGQEGNWMATGFSPRKQALTLYIMPGYANYQDLLKKLGPHKLGKSCLYIKRFEDINVHVLEKLIKAGLTDLKKQYPVS